MNHKASNVFQIDFPMPKNKREDKNKIHNRDEEKKAKRNIELESLGKNNIFFFNAHNFLVSRIFLLYILFLYTFSIETEI